MRSIVPLLAAIVLLAVVCTMLHSELFDSTAAADAYVDSADSAGLRFQFHNSPTSRKYLIESMGGGVAVFDYDNDGWQDIFLVNGAKLKDPQPDGEAPNKSSPEFWNRLFRNNHDGSFSDVTIKAGLQGHGYGMGVATGDFNNDGFPDLLVTTYGGAILYRNNGDGTFTDITRAAHLSTQGWTTGAGFFDYNNDGCLDLFISRYLEWDFAAGGKFCGVQKPGGRAYCHPDEFQSVANYLFRGNCTGEFTDVSGSSGIAAVKGKDLGVAFGDFNHDGFLDIYVANDSYQQLLFRNNGDGTFSEVGTTAGVGYNEDGRVFSGMGAAFVDIDNDGFPDILTTALPYEYYAFFHNNRDGTFQYASVTSGLARATRSFGGWGIFVFDFDNDGQKELFLANSHVMDNIDVTQPHLRYLQPPQLLRYSGAKFLDISAQSGAVFHHQWAARGAAFGDFDNNGYLDILASDYNRPVHLLRNRTSHHNHWIGLDLRGTQSNRDAIGAEVEIATRAGKIQRAMVSTAGSYLSANDRRVFFGTGEERSIGQIRIQWPSGTVQVVRDPKPDRIMTIVEQRSSPLEQRSDNAGEEQFRNGMVLAKEGNVRAAIRAFQNAVRLEPSLMEAHFSLGVLLARQGKQYYDAALEEFFAVLRLHPDDIDAHINLSNLLEEGKDFAASAAEMRKAVSLTSRRSDLFLMLGNKEQNADLYADAIVSYREALKLRPDLLEAHYRIGTALLALHQPGSAADEFSMVLASNPRHAAAHYELGRALAASGDLDGAVSHLKRAIELEPGINDARLELGRAYRRQGNLQAAADAFRGALLATPDSSQALYELATISKILGQSEQANAYFARMRAISRNQSDTGEANRLNGDGIMQMNRGDLEGALRAFRKALGSDPDFATAAYNIGVVLAHQGKRAEAIRALRNAIRIRPGFAQAHFALGLLLELEGDANAKGELQLAHALESLAPKESKPDPSLAPAPALIAPKWPTGPS